MSTHDGAGRESADGNPARLKDDIDSGRAGDKVPGFDPAAAPLGTDAEAAGAPPSGGASVHAQAREAARGSKVENPNASTPELQPDAQLNSPQRNLPLMAALGVAAALAIVAVIYLAL